MAEPILEFDPSAESSGSPLTVTGGNYGLESFNAPAPPAKFQWASSVDTEGAQLASRGHENRVISVVHETANNAALVALQAKIAKLHREGGTLKYTTPGGVSITFDVLASDGYEATFDFKHMLGDVTTVGYQLTCKPYGRGAEQDLGDNTETTLPVLIFTEASIPGDVPALGRLVGDNDGTLDWWGILWAVQSRYYSADSTAAFFYEAEGRTALGGSATAAGPSGASGGGSNVVRNTALASSFQAVLSTQATGGGSHLSHIGTFHVYARIQIPTTNSGDVTVALEWGEGDFRRVTQNAAQALSANLEGKWLLVDLGFVSLTETIVGTQRWEGRLLAKSTVAGDDVDIDWLAIVPVNEGSGIAEAVIRQTSPTVFTARDEFDQTAGALNGKTLPVGGTWATSGSATDFSVTGSGTVTRATAVSGQRVAYAGTSTLAGCEASLDVYTTKTFASIGPSQGLIVRAVDANNYAAIIASNWLTLSMWQFVGGVGTLLASTPATSYDPTTGLTLRIQVDAGGRFFIWATPLGSTRSSAPVLTGQSSALATGGALASGKGGILDDYGSTTETRTYDNFWFAAFTSDAGVFTGQSIQVDSSAAVREDSSGSVWSTVSSYVGDYLRVPPSGAESRTARLIVKPLYHPEDVTGVRLDDRADDISARLFVTPRYLVLPS